MKVRLLTESEELMMEIGYDELPLQDKNRIIYTVSNLTGKTVAEVGEEDILEHHKDLKKHEMSALCSEKINAGIESTNGNTYSTDKEAQLNFISKYTQLLGRPEIDEVEWETNNQGRISHTREEWLDLFNEVMDHKDTILSHYSDVKKAIREAKTHKDVYSIKWDLTEPKED